MSRVLIVDDEVEITEFLSNFLKRFKIINDKANDGLKALEIFKKFKPTWVLLDIKMPGMDGFEFLEKIKNLDPSVKVIMITGREDKQSQEKAKQLGALDYIVKPLDLEELHHKIETWILAK